MVLKQFVSYSPPWISFENDVKMYGTQAYQKPLCTGVTFENDVKMYGTQA